MQETPNLCSNERIACHLASTSKMLICSFCVYNSPHYENIILKYTSVRIWKSLTYPRGFFHNKILSNNWPLTLRNHPSKIKWNCVRRSSRKHPETEWWVKTTRQWLSITRNCFHPKSKTTPQLYVMILMKHNNWFINLSILTWPIPRS